MTFVVRNWGFIPHNKKKRALKTFSEGLRCWQCARLASSMLAFKFLVFFFIKLENFLCCCVLFNLKFSCVELETKLKIGFGSFNLTKYLNLSKPMEH